MAITAVIGGQWGDEGKGKIVDFLCRDVNMVARFQGGANAGHTVYKGDQKIVLHQIPSGILTENCQCVLGNGMVIDPVDLVEELDMLTKNGVHFNGSIHIAANAHIVTPVHKLPGGTDLFVLMIDIILQSFAHHQLHSPWTT